MSRYAWGIDTVLGGLWLRRDRDRPQRISENDLELLYNAPVSDDLCNRDSNTAAATGVTGISKVDRVLAAAREYDKRWGHLYNEQRYADNPEGREVVESVRALDAKVPRYVVIAFPGAYSVYEDGKEFLSLLSHPTAEKIAAALNAQERAK